MSRPLTVMLNASVALSLLGPATSPADSAPDWANDFLGPTVIKPDGTSENAAARYWTDIVGIPFTRDVRIEIPPTPLDLDLDGKPDAIFSGNWSLEGGVLGSPKKIGLVPTPDDPAGTAGRYSISTGFLGVREEMDSATKRGTGRFGFTCFFCHGSADANGNLVYGRPNVNLDLGLMMAASSALTPNHVVTDPDTKVALSPDELRKRERLDGTFKFDSNGDGRVTIAEWRAGMNLASADETRAELLLAGPGRLDQSVDHRMDGTIPLANLQQYSLAKQGPDEYLRHAKMLKRAMFNPVSVPSNLSGLGVSHYAWTGKDSSMRHDAVALIAEKMKTSPDELARLIRFPSHEPVDYEALSRALTLDFRNTGTSGRESDFPLGNAWALLAMTRPDRDLFTHKASWFGTVELREMLTRHPNPKPMTDPLVRRGLEVFTQAEVGRIINQRVVQGREAHLPQAYPGMAVIGPIDRSRNLDSLVPVRCASCHNHTPLSTMKPIEKPIQPMQRCDLCHFDHPNPDREGEFVPLVGWMRGEKLESAADCTSCHEEHPDFGPQVYSNSWTLPFDADGDGDTYGDEADDASAGGIGTDAHLNVDTLFTVQLKPKRRRPKRMYLLTRDVNEVPARPEFSKAGYGWVRVAPLVQVSGSAPYLHNGSVPTLEALLTAPADRPASFAVGLPEQNYTFNTSLPGNYNTGHDFGTKLPEEDRQALIAFLRWIE